MDRVDNASAQTGDDPGQPSCTPTAYSQIEPKGRLCRRSSAVAGISRTFFPLITNWSKLR